MEWKGQLARTPYLVLFTVLMAIGVGTASALITITLSGDVIITGSLDMTGDKISNVGTPTSNSDVATKDYVDQSPSTDTLSLLGCTTDQIVRFNGSHWVCGKQTVKNNPIHTLDSSGSVGSHTSIAIGIDNNPVVSYRDITNFGDLKVVKCKNPVCSTTNTPLTLDSGSASGSVGQYSSIAIGIDGNPVISYYDTTNEDLKVAIDGTVLLFE